jgi:hypothetical protein
MKRKGKRKSDPGQHNTWEIPEEILCQHPSIMPIPHDYIDRGDTNKYEKWVRVIRADEAERIKAENEILKQKLRLMDWLYSFKTDPKDLAMPDPMVKRAIEWAKEKTGFQRPVREHRPFIEAWDAAYVATMQHKQTLEK